MSAFWSFCFTILCVTGYTLSDDSKCSAVSPIQKMKDTEMVGPWYQMKASANGINNCIIYKNQLVRSGSYKSEGRGNFPNGTEYRRVFTFKLLDSTDPAGKILELTDGYAGKLIVMYILDLTREGMLTTVYCNGNEEIVEVFSHDKTINESRVKEVLKKNKLDTVTLKDTFVNCPGHIDSFTVPVPVPIPVRVFT